MCLEHADEHDLNAELKPLGDEGAIDARGVTISAALLNRILAAAPRDPLPPDRPRLNKVQFEGATFGKGASFQGATIGDWAIFDRAHFGAKANFKNVTFGNGMNFEEVLFEEGADFDGATFGDAASFVRLTFEGRSTFSNVTFGKGAAFVRAYFEDGPNFDGATFGDEANFGVANFGESAWFERTTFGDWAFFDNAAFEWARFDGAEFGDWARFPGTTFEKGARFDAATFGRWTRFGPLLGRERIVLDHAAFGQGSELAVSADQLDCRAMRLPDGAWLNVRWAEVRLEGVDFGRPSVLAGVDPFPGLDEARLQSAVMRSWRTSRPRVLSMRGSDVRNLVLSNVDLRACRFSGAHNLDQLRLEATIDLADRPAGLRTGWALPPLWRWTRRRTLAEEHRWRRTQAKHADWYPRPCRVRGLAKLERALQPGDIALLYRALRKGREDSKDEPGAADFYYGEMEMRRRDRTAPWPERLVLWLYWLVAGYALRASRALGCLLALLVVATFLLAVAGFAPAPSSSPLAATITGTPPKQHVQFTAQPPPAMTAQQPLSDRLGTAAVVAVEGAVFRTSEQELTYKGRLIQATLRFAGPVLLGLALLSIRGRVKR
jgi:uncharacterized protein YjbI with pentapeptide repeats